MPNQNEGRRGVLRPVFYAACDRRVPASVCARGIAPPNFRICFVWERHQKGVSGAEKSAWPGSNPARGVVLRRFRGAPGPWSSGKTEVRNERGDTGIVHFREACPICSLDRRASSSLISLSRSLAAASRPPGRRVRRAPAPPRTWKRLLALRAADPASLQPERPTGGAAGPPRPSTNPSPARRTLGHCTTAAMPDKCAES